MTMEPKITVQLFLLMINPEKGYYHAYANYFSYGLLGAALMDLHREGIVVVQDNKIQLQTDSKTHLAFLDRFVDKLSKRKVMKTSTLLMNIAYKFPSFKKELTSHLIVHHKIVKIKKKFLFIPYYRYFPAEREERQALVRRLRDVLLRNEAPNLDELYLISLLPVCMLFKPLSNIREERKIMKKKATEICKEVDETGNKISDIVLLSSCIKKAIISANATRSAAAVG